jgi:hypothetical protein
MLIQYTPVSSLDPATKQRLIAQSKSLLLTNEAAEGRVMFEGKYFHATEVLALSSLNRTFLTES